MGRSEPESWDVFAGVSLDANTPSSSIFSVNALAHSDKSRNWFPGAGTMSLFLFVLLMPVGCRDWFPDAGMLVLSLRVVEVSSEMSRGNDVEDVLALELEEPVDNLGTTIGSLFSRLHWIILSFLVRCGFRRVREDLYRHEKLKVVDVYCCFLICLHYPIGCDNRCSVSGYANDFQFR